MRKYKSSNKNNSSNKKYTINTKSNVIFEDRHINKNDGAIFRVIKDKNAPFYQYKHTDFQKWKEENR